MISRDQALAILRRHKAELKALGISRVAVFGSVSRGDARLTSDLDIMIELDPAEHLTAFDYAGIQRRVAELFPVRTDVVARDAMKTSISAAATRDAVYAF